MANAGGAFLAVSVDDGRPVVADLLIVAGIQFAGRLAGGGGPASGFTASTTPCRTWPESRVSLRVTPPGIEIAVPWSQDSSLGWAKAPGARVTTVHKGVYQQ